MSIPRGALWRNVDVVEADDSCGNEVVRMILPPAIDAETRAAFTAMPDPAGGD